jgi:hypothetical protein
MKVTRAITLVALVGVLATISYEGYAATHRSSRLVHAAVVAPAPVVTVTHVQTQGARVAPPRVVATTVTKVVVPTQPKAATTHAQQTPVQPIASYNPAGWSCSVAPHTLAEIVNNSGASNRTATITIVITGAGPGGVSGVMETQLLEGVADQPNGTTMPAKYEVRSVSPHADWQPTGATCTVTGARPS